MPEDISPTDGPGAPEGPEDDTQSEDGEFSLRKPKAVTYAGVKLFPGILHIKVISAADLPCADFSLNPFNRKGSSDPYVEATVWPFLPTATGVLNVRTVRTKTISQNINPVWNETLEITYDWEGADPGQRSSGIGGNLIPTGSSSAQLQAIQAVTNNLVNGADQQKTFKKNAITRQVNMNSYLSPNLSVIQKEAEGPEQPQYDVACYEEVIQLKEQFLIFQEQMRKQNRQILKELQKISSGNGIVTPSRLNKESVAKLGGGDGMKNSSVASSKALSEENCSPRH